MSDDDWSSCRRFLFVGRLYGLVSGFMSLGKLRNVHLSHRLSPSMMGIVKVAGAFLHVFLLIPLVTASESSKRKSITDLVSPVSHWEEAWAASTVTTSVVAVECTLEDDSSAVVFLLNKSPRRPAERVPGIDIDGVTCFPARPSDQWMLMDSVFICMTGLSSDVDYLFRVILRQDDEHKRLYDDRYKLKTTDIVQILADRLRDNTVYEGERCYAVQSVISGLNKKGRFSLYSLEPSGGIQSWPSATAMGKNAKALREQLFKGLKKETSTGLKEVLHVALECLLDNSGHEDAAEAQGLLLCNRDPMVVYEMDIQSVWKYRNTQMEHNEIL